MASKRSKRSKRSDALQLRGAAPVTCGGTVLFTSAGSAGLQTVLLHPLNLSTRTADIANSYSNYRFTRLKFTLMPSAAQTSVMGYTDQVESPAATTATTAIQASEWPCAKLITAACTVPQKMSIPKRFLRGKYEWYTCTTTTDIIGTGGGGAGAGSYLVQELVYQGALMILQTTANAQNFWIEYEVQFKDPSFGNSAPGPLALKSLSTLTEDQLFEEIRRRRDTKVVTEEDPPFVGGVRPRS